MLRARPSELIVYLLFAAALCVLACRQIDGSAVVKDAAQNLQMGINLAHHGVISEEEAAPLRPSMYREPLPVAVDALTVAATDVLLGKPQVSGYFSGRRALCAKLQNVLWLPILSLAVLAITRRATGSLVAGVIAAALAAKPFLADTGINSLYTELPAAALMMLSIGALAATQSVGGWRAAVATGFLFGLLTLTKAATLYVFVFTAAVILAGRAAGMLWRGPAHRNWHLGGMVLAFALVVAPWMLRNLHTFGHAQISSRGGLVLYSRALWDELTPIEYRGTFYVWARPALQPLLGRWLGFSPADLERGGKLERLSDEPGTSVYANDNAAEAAGRPQDAIGLHRRARAERNRLTREFELAGQPFPDVAADQAMEREGMRIVVSHFGANLALVVPLIWRSALLILPAMLVGWIYGLRARRRALSLMLVPGLATVGFYALATHFEPRPAAVVQSSAVVALVVAGHALWRRYRTRTIAAGRVAKHDEV